MKSTGGLRRGLLAAMLVMAGLLAAAPAGAASPDAGASVIGGEPTTTERWPWMVALAKTPAAEPDESPRERQFCGGSIIAPTVVLTAAHCTIDMETGHLEDYEVIAGRTNLDRTSAGTTSGVRSIHFPLTPNGFPRFLLQIGWDVALLELDRPLPQRRIRLAGPDERGILRPGRRLIETGWGTTKGRRLETPATLMMSRTNIQPASVCKEQTSGLFESDSQLCLGDAFSSQTTCYGDSGGPTMVATRTGFRLVGVTSYGPSSCPSDGLSVDAFVGGEDLGNWIQQKVVTLAGVDPVGSGGTAGPVPALCRVPVLRLKPVRWSLEALRRSGCRNVKLKRIKVPFRRYHQRVVVAPFGEGWLTIPNRPITLLVGVYERRKKRS